MKPGLTCLWQVSGRSELDFDRWMALDLKYIDTWSPLLDLKILLKTVPAVLVGPRRALGGSGCHPEGRRPEGPLFTERSPSTRKGSLAGLGMTGARDDA